MMRPRTLCNRNALSLPSKASPFRGERQLVLPSAGPRYFFGGFIAAGKPMAWS